MGEQMCRGGEGRQTSLGSSIWLENLFPGASGKNLMLLFTACKPNCAGRVQSNCWVEPEVQMWVLLPFARPHAPPVVELLQHAEEFPFLHAASPVISNESLGITLCTQR